jgi:hypothetical protein
VEEGQQVKADHGSINVGNKSGDFLWGLEDKDKEPRLKRKRVAERCGDGKREKNRING